MFYVYLLHSTKDNGFYIGFSTNLKRRLAEHTRGASFATKSRGPWKLIYYEAYLNQEDALGREKYLKSGSGRRFLRAQLRHYLLQEPAKIASLHAALANVIIPRRPTDEPRGGEASLRGYVRERAIAGSSFAARRAGK